MNRKELASGLQMRKSIRDHVQVAIQTLRKGSTESIEEIRGGSARSTTSSHPRK